MRNQSSVIIDPRSDRDPRTRVPPSNRHEAVRRGDGTDIAEGIAREGLPATRGGGSTTQGDGRPRAAGLVQKK